VKQIVFFSWNNVGIFFFLVTGTSILQDILDIKLPTAIIIDYQHVTLLRHTKTVLNTIYKGLSPSRRERLDIKLKNQCFPHFFNRRMKSFNKLSFIKAVELRNVLIYGFLPLSYEFVKREQLAHIALFIKIIQYFIISFKTMFFIYILIMATNMLIMDH
jgi:hypothetical protein